MTTMPDLSAVAILVLVRLLPAGEKGEIRDKLGKDLKPLVQHRWEGSAWTDRLDRALRERESAGSIVRIKKGKTERLTLTPEGSRQALRAVGLETLPPKTTWGKLKAPFLVAYALGTDVKRLATASGLKVELLRQGHELDLGDHPTVKQATDALAGKLMGLESGRPFTMDSVLSKLLRDDGIAIRPGQKPTLKNIQEALLRRELGDPGAKNPLDLLVARSVGARQSKPAELGEAVLRAWVDRAEARSGTDENATQAPSLEEFAASVQEAARSSLSGWFGDGKVFISHVWKLLSDRAVPLATDLEAFKARLVEAHHARLLELGRADLVAAMDPLDVRESATPDLNAVYHFVRVEKLP